MMGLPELTDERLSRALGCHSLHPLLQNGGLYCDREKLRDEKILFLEIRFFFFLSLLYMENWRIRAECCDTPPEMWRDVCPGDIDVKMFAQQGGTIGSEQHAVAPSAMPITEGAAHSQHAK
jgi:hypothetical protein